MTPLVLIHHAWHDWLWGEGHSILLTRCLLFNCCCCCCCCCYRIVLVSDTYYDVLSLTEEAAVSNVYIYCWIDCPEMPCRILSCPATEGLNPYLFLRRSHHITSHHIATDPNIGRWYVILLYSDRTSPTVFSLDLSCVIWQLILGHRSLDSKEDALYY